MGRFELANWDQPSDNIISTVFVIVSDVYIRRDNVGIITPSSLIIDNLIYFLSNGNASVSVNIDFSCDSYFSWQEITVGFH